MNLQHAQRRVLPAKEPCAKNCRPAANWPVVPSSLASYAICTTRPHMISKTHECTPTNTAQLAVLGVTEYKAFEPSVQFLEASSFFHSNKRRRMSHTKQIFVPPPQASLSEEGTLPTQKRAHRVLLAGPLRYARFGRRHARQHVPQLARLIAPSGRIPRRAAYFRAVSRRRIVGRRRGRLRGSCCGSVSGGVPSVLLAQEDVDAGDAQARAIGEADPALGRDVARQNRVPVRAAPRHQDRRDQRHERLRYDAVWCVLRVQTLQWVDRYTCQPCSNKT